MITSSAALSSQRILAFSCRHIRRISLIVSSYRWLDHMSLFKYTLTNPDTIPSRMRQILLVSVYIDETWR
jgi:hypothetical protein